MFSQSTRLPFVVLRMSIVSMICIYSSFLLSCGSCCLANEEERAREVEQGDRYGDTKDRRYVLITPRREKERLDNDRYWRMMSCY